MSRLFTTILVFCAFTLSTTGIFAQEAPQNEGLVQEEYLVIEEAPAIDPIIAAEQALSLEDGAALSQPASGTSTLGILRMLLTLAVAAAAIYGIVYLIKRVSRGNVTRDPFLKVLGSTALGTNRSAHIISVGSQAWLVGSAESGVNLISEIQDKDILNAMLLEDSRKSADGASSDGGGRLPDFKTLLQRLGVQAQPGSPPGPESIRRRGERLKGL